jgi:hypothetical protein
MAVGAERLPTPRETTLPQKQALIGLKSDSSFKAGQQTQTLLPGLGVLGVVLG